MEEGVVEAAAAWCRRSDLLRAFISRDKNISPSAAELRVLFLSSISEWLADRSLKGMARFFSACGSGVIAGVRITGWSVVDTESLRLLLRVSDGVSSPPSSCSVPVVSAEEDLRVRQEMGSSAIGGVCPACSCATVRSGGARVAGCFAPFLCEKAHDAETKRDS